MAEFLFLHNPSSRAGASRLARVRDLLSSPSVPSRPRAEFVSIRDLEAIRRLPDRIVVVGGDGSVNAAVEWLSRRGETCDLGIVPAGTGNNLARGLGIPLEPQAALRLALSGERARPLDVFQYDDGNETRHIVQTSALGFPAAMAARYDRLRRNSILRVLFRPAGPYVYRVIGLLGLAGQKIKERRGESLMQVELELPGEKLEETVFAIFIGNERSLGGNFIPCPKARVDDGRMDICMVRAGTGASYLKLFRSIVRGEHLDLAETVLYRQTPGPISLRLSEPSPLLADGDLWASSDNYRLSVLPSRVKVVCG